MKKLLASFTLLMASLSLVPTVAFAQTPAPRCTISASPAAVQLGQTTNLSWDSSNATQGTITTIGNVASKGKQGVIPTATQRTYVGTFVGPGGTGTCSVTVQITGSGGAAVDIGGEYTNSNTYNNSNTYQNDNTFNATAGQGTAGSVSSGQNTVDTQPAGQGLVPCNGAEDCQMCNLAQLSQRIINFLIGISIPIAVALFAYAGWLYFTSSVVDNLGKARKILMTAAVGFFIAISAWLVIQTFLKVILNQNSYKGWNTIQCTQNRKTNTSINDLLGSIPALNTNAPQTVGVSSATPSDRINGGFASFTPSCSSGYELTNDEAGNRACYNVNTSDYQPPTYNPSSNISNPQMAEEIANACSQYGMSSAACALAGNIANNESSGGRNCTTSSTGAAGCMQVLARTACGMDPSISDSCSACMASGNSIRPQCAPVIQTISSNTQLGTNLGVQYINQMYQMYGGNCQLAAAAYFQGPGAVQKAGGVPANAVSYVNKACK